MKYVHFIVDLFDNMTAVFEVFKLKCQLCRLSLMLLMNALNAYQLLNSVIIMNNSDSGFWQYHPTGVL